MHARRVLSCVSLLSVGIHGLAPTLWQPLPSQRVLCQRSSVPHMVSLNIVNVDLDTFDEEVLSFDGLAVVKFYAPWCRTCKNTAAKYDRVVDRVVAQTNRDDVRFFQVNFKENKQLCLRERVFALPSIHFYTKSIGRVNRFTLSVNNVKPRMDTELDRYLGETDHLGFLKAIAASESNPVNPLAIYRDLVAIVQALKDAPEIVAEVTNNDKGLSKEFSRDSTRMRELESLFSAIDRNNDGSIDADELASVAAAIGAVDSSDTDTVYGALLDRATSALTDEDGVPLEEVVNKPEQLSVGSGTLDRDSFFRLMTMKRVADFAKPEAELKPAFDALDKDGNGDVTEEEFREAMGRVCTNLPDVVDADGCRDWARETAVAFAALDRDKSGTLDYEEFVAMLSGVNQPAMMQ